MAAHALYEGPVAKRPRHINNGYPQNSMPSYDHHQQPQQNQMAQYSNMQQMSVPYDSSYMYSNMQQAQEYDAFSDANMNPQYAGFNQNFMNNGSQNMSMNSNGGLFNEQQTTAMTSSQMNQQQIPMNSNGSMPTSSNQMNQQQHVHGQQHYSDPNLPSTSQQMPQQTKQMQPVMSQSGYSLQMPQPPTSVINPMPTKSVSPDAAMFQHNDHIQQQQPQTVHSMYNPFQRSCPATPNLQMQQQMAPPLVPELQYNMHHVPDYGNHNQLQMNVPANAKEVTTDLMRHFLANSEFYTCSLTVHFPKAAQKSYKNEKRFFVPPPTVTLEGNGWSNSKLVSGRFGTENCSPTVSMLIAGVDDTKTELHPTQLDGNKLLLTAKSMYISTVEKKKMLTLGIEILLSTNFTLGPFISERIKIMSKPSKKKQIAIGPEARYLSIKSGSRIALYNRLRSQNISTRFFHVKENGLTEASSNQWSVLEILLIQSYSDTESPIPGFAQAQKGARIETKDGNINYGDVVVLVDVATGIALLPMRIRKTVQMDKAYYTNDEASGEPVSQLHMIVFEFLDKPQTYLHANPEFLKTCSGAVAHDGAVSVNDGCRWTIISAEATTHKFAPLLGRPKRPVAPMPVVWEVEDDREVLHGQKAIELRGSFSKDDISVWFGVMKAPVTKFESPEAISAVIPPLDQYHAAYPPEVREHPDIEKRALPINLVRDDGVVYSTEFVLEYNTKSKGCIGRVLHEDFLIYEQGPY